MDSSNLLKQIKYQYHKSKCKSQNKMFGVSFWYAKIISDPDLDKSKM